MKHNFAPVVLSNNVLDIICGFMALKLKSAIATISPLANIIEILTTVPTL